LQNQTGLRQKLGKVIEYTEDVLAISCLGTVAQSYMWGIPVNNMFTYDEGVALLLVLELNSGLLHYCTYILKGGICGHRIPQTI